MLLWFSEPQQQYHSKIDDLIEETMKEVISLLVSKVNVLIFFSKKLRLDGKREISISAFCKEKMFDTFHVPVFQIK